MHELAAVIRLTESEFEALRPLNGQIIVKPSHDMTRMVFNTLELEVDVTYKPENHQEVFNKVVKIPDSPRYSDTEYACLIDVEPGDDVIVNYFPILQAPIILVGEDLYRFVPYKWVICKVITVSDVQKARNGVDSFLYGVRMLNDYLLVDKIELPQHKLELEQHKKHSKLYYEVVVPNTGTYEYRKRSNKLLAPAPEEIVLLKDSAVFVLEPEGYYHLDGKKHYVARQWKILSIVEQID